MRLKGSMQAKNKKKLKLEKAKKQLQALTQNELGLVTGGAIPSSVRPGNCG